MKLASTSDRAAEDSGTGYAPAHSRRKTKSFPKSFAVRRIAGYLDLAGIRVNGPAAWDIQIHDPRFFRRVLREGSLGLGESYVEGWWDAVALDELFARLHRAELLPYR